MPDMTSDPSELYIPRNAPARVSASTVCRWLGIHSRTLRLWVARGFVPKPKRLGLLKLHYDTEAIRKVVRGWLEDESGRGRGESDE